MKLSIKQYAALLDQALVEAGEHESGAVIKGFAATLVEDDKSSRTSEILQIWKGLYNKRHGIVDAHVTVAHKEDALFPKQFGGKKVALEVVEDPSLVGGAVTRVGDYIIDTSIKAKINALRQ